MTSPATTADIKANVARVRDRIARACDRAGRSPSDVTLIAVSKTWPAGSVLEAAAAGITDFGENRVQEALPKVAAVNVATSPTSVFAHGTNPTWHFIGHLQSNKVRDALSIARFIHSVDSEKLLRVISSNAEAPVEIFLEVNVGGEESKFGFVPEQVTGAVALARSLPHIRLAGLMTVAPRVSNPEEARPYFRQLAELAREHGLPHLSMGMTEDFEVAIEEGATHVRVGRAIFGERQ